MRIRMVVGAIGAAALIAGCGGSDEYANDDRPPAPINLSVSVTDERVAISPSRVGAGPVMLIVSNQSRASRDVRLTPPEGSSSACLDADASSGPINPMGTTKLQLDLVEGECVVSVRGRGVQPARLTVGRPRETAQAELLQP